MKMADEYLAQVTNVYRTREYIVFQEIGISDDPERERICIATIPITAARCKKTVSMRKRSKTALI